MSSCVAVHRVVSSQTIVEIKTGTLSGVLKQAGISREEFNSALADT